MNCLGVETGDKEGNVGWRGVGMFTRCIFWLLNCRCILLRLISATAIYGRWNSSLC